MLLDEATGVGSGKTEGRELYWERRKRASHNYLTTDEGSWPKASTTHPRRLNPETETETIARTSINFLFPAAIVKTVIFPVVFQFTCIILILMLFL
jgi:hypothetical protein